MQTSNRLFDDLARVASGAFNTLSGLREEIETRVRERVERMASDLDLVNREDFDAVRAMAPRRARGRTSWRPGWRRSRPSWPRCSNRRARPSRAKPAAAPQEQAKPKPPKTPLG